MRLTALLFLLCAMPAVHAQPPAPTPPAPPATLDQLLDRITDLRKQRADLDKLEAAAVSDLKAKFKELQDKLDKLGLVGPPPAPPAPPAPPTPPTPPAPADPLKTKILTAFNTAAGSPTQKSEWAKDLAALYRASLKMAADKSVTTASALRTKLKDAATTLLAGDDALKEVRQVVAIELAAVLPTAEADLTDDHRISAAALFTKLAAILDGM